MKKCKNNKKWKKKYFDEKLIFIKKSIAFIWFINYIDKYI